MSTRRRHPDDSGQIALGLMLLVTVLLLVLAVRVFVPFGQATDQKASSRGAADAAALAAAEQIQDDLADALLEAIDAARTADDLLGVMDALDAGFGRQAASEYADHNDADLIGYRYSRSDGRVWAEVRYREAAQNGDRAESDAVADLGLDLGPCVLPDEPSATPTTDDDADGDADEDADDEPADSETTLVCGDLELDFTLDGASGTPELETDLDDLLDDLKTALVA
ncbi:hypothetical protein KIH74_27095 [Kineosporia sp. J2-2]|uniref:Flp pilus-assembly TadE/G-like protein n=1 Tax=Kineosporia corallincola TaxID=2835133 RepID=A0ABS5TNG5_9ACTN|nr:hypothetical protein [Kineosporia corallincola]MBT0772640.1 hypothetical protein [Kineosporia corallincola]